MGEPCSSTIPPPRARLYRLLFILAGAYNLGFGAWAVLRPHSFFDLFHMEIPRYPAIWQCLGMVIGLYGLGYGHAAFRLDQGRVFIAIGLLGKLLGPIGWFTAVNAGEWPVQTFTLIAFNDILWWLPFLLFLIDGTRVGGIVRGSAPFVCAVVNVIATAAMAIVLKPGSEIVPNYASRVVYIRDNLVAWRVGWVLWIGAGLSLVAFFAWWACRIDRPGWGVAAFAVSVFGLACDVFAESLFIGWLPADIEAISPVGTILTAVAANGSYTVAGVILTLASKSLGRFMRAWAWAIWLSGIALTASGLAGGAAGLVASTAVMMTLFCPWAAIFGWQEIRRGAFTFPLST